MIEYSIAFWNWISNFILDILRTTSLGYFFLLLIALLAVEFIFNFIKEVSL